MNIYIHIHGCISTCAGLAAADLAVRPPACLRVVVDHVDGAGAGVTSSEHKGTSTWML